MTRPPPRPPLFPTRRSSDLGYGRRGNPDGPGRREPLARAAERLGVEDQVELEHRLSVHVETLRGTGERSEEHTSELQSLRHLVCRLLLEKKKKKSNSQCSKC